MLKSTQMGRVNFLENVGLGGNLLEDRMNLISSEVKFRLAKYLSPDLIHSIDEVLFLQLPLGFIRSHVNGGPLPFRSEETERIGFT